MKISSYVNKIIYIFGGSSGIGLEIARQLSSLGAHVGVFSRNEERLKKATEDIRKYRRETFQEFFFQQVDVSIPKKVENVIHTSVEQYGVPDILVNCAGHAHPNYFENISYEMFEETMKINLFGVWNTISSALPYMKRKGGIIVNTSSVAGFIGPFGYTDYAASKFGIIGFSEALRSELKKYNISVSILCPPDTNTPGFEIENQTKPEETKALTRGSGILGVDQVARELIKKMKTGKKLIIPGFDAKLSYYIKRYCPGLMDFIIDRTILKTQKQKRKIE